MFFLHFSKCSINIKDTWRGIEVVITGLTRNHVCIWVVVPPKTAEKPWFCWIFAWLMIFLTIVSNGFSKKLNNDCFPRFRGWTYTERYRSGYNGPDSKSGVQKCTEGSNPSLSAIKGLQNRCSPWKPRFYRGFHRLYGEISANRFDRYKNDVFPLLDVLNSHTTE